MTVRDIEIAAEPIDAYEAAVEVLEDATTHGSFKVVLDEAAHRYSISWETRVSGSRYDFRFQRLGARVTRVEVELGFSGAIGWLIGLLRAAGNGPHLDRILDDIRKLAESGVLPDDADEVDEDDDAGEHADDEWMSDLPR